MTFAPDDSTRKKIVMMKQMFGKALMNGKSDSSIDKIMSVIGFDLANEAILNLLASTLDPTKTKSGTFSGILDQVGALFQEKQLGSVPDRGNIVHVHKIRNSAQHEARYPNNTELSDCETYTRDFLKKTVKKVWNLDFEKISIVSLIKDKYCKEHLEDAEKLLQNQDFTNSTQKSMAALQHAVNCVKANFIGYKPALENVAVIDRSRGIKASHAYDTMFEKMQNILLLSILGIEMSAYLNAKTVTGIPQFRMGSEEPTFYNGKTNVTLNDAEHLLHYCSTTILSIESKVGDIKNPFGTGAGFF